MSLKENLLGLAQTAAAPLLGPYACRYRHQTHFSKFPDRKVDEAKAKRPSRRVCKPKIFRVNQSAISSEDSLPWEYYLPPLDL